MYAGQPYGVIEYAGILGEEQGVATLAGLATLEATAKATLSGIITLEKQNNVATIAGDILLERNSAILGSKVGTVTASMAANVAFLNDSGQSFGRFAGAAGQNKKYKIIATDSAGKTATGYIGEQGTGETLGGELVTNGNFANWAGVFPDELPTGWIYVGTHNANNYVTQNPAGQCQFISDGTGFGIGQDAIFFLGYLLKYSINTVSITGTYKISDGGGDWGPYISSSGIVSGYLNSYRGLSLNLYRGGVVNATIDDTSFKQVLTPTTSGVKIYSTKTGSTQSWANVETDFNANSISSYTIYAEDETLAGIITLEKTVKNTLAGISTLEKQNVIATIAGTATLERESKATIAGMITLERQNVIATIAGSSDLEAVRYSTMAGISTLERANVVDNLAGISTLEATKKETLAGLATLEATVFGTLAGTSQFEKANVIATIAGTITLEKQNVRESIAGLITLERQNVKATLAGTATLEKQNVKATIAGISTLEKQNIKATIAGSIMLQKQGLSTLAGTILLKRRFYPYSQKTSPYTKIK